MITLPRYDKRTAIVGSTGSGKTFLACWLLSTRDFDRRVWIIFDFKGDELIEDIGAQEISVRGPIPKKPGLYVVRPIPELDDEAVTALLWKIWEHGSIGIYIDEGYMIRARDPAFNACLTQGRSKHIEMIVLSQRPTWLSRFVWSESNYFGMMNLTNEDDRKLAEKFIGGHRLTLLPEYHSLWYETQGQKGTVLKPVPGRDELLKRFQERLSKKRGRI